MTRSPASETDSLTMFPEKIVKFVPPISAAALFVSAFIAALFFNGVRIEFFTLSLILLMLYLMIVVWRGHANGLHISVSPLPTALTLFWMWLAITQFWSPAPYISMVNFWWVGGGIFVFWLMTLVPDKRQPYPAIFASLLVVGALLALLSIYQHLRLGMQAQSTFLTRNSHAALMCLFAIPASAYFLLSHGHSRNRIWLAVLLGIALFLLYVSLGLTGSRGANLGLILGLGVLVMSAVHKIPRQQLAIFFCIVFLAYLAANLLGRGELFNRLGTLVLLEKADPERLLIWQQSWKMLMENPWLGIGLGTYWLHWPPYRHPADGSGGFYVHNDYLQIWIETGLPGLVLLLAIYVAVLAVFVRLMRHPEATDSERIEAAGLFGGLLAIAVHTFFDFDLYILPIQLALGLVLARLHALYLKRVPADTLVVMPASRIALRPYRVVSFLVVLLPLIYFAALGASAMLTYKARELSVQGKWVDASMAFSRAAQLMPTSDLVFTSHADLLRQALAQLPPGNSVDRRTLYREALALLDDAEKMNPLRPQIYFVRGLLYQQAPDLTGPDWARRATDAYRQALKRDPLAFWAREACARLLLAQGQLRPAREVLEGGLAYRYAGNAVVGYYRLAAEVRRQTGDTPGAAALARRIFEMTGQSLNPPGQVPAGALGRQSSG